MAPKKTKTINWSSVQEAVLYEILLKLPVKSLCRFRCVSKSWFSIISDPKFMSAHFDHSLANPKVLLVSVPKYNNNGSSYELICSVDYAEWGVRKWGNRPQSLTADYHGIIRHQYTIARNSQSVGGLSLVESCLVESGNTLVICNPSTRESIRFKLPPCPVDSDYCHSRSYLGFDPIEKKYKVLSSWVEFEDECWNYVLTLGEEAWRSVECKYAPAIRSLMGDHNNFQLDSAGICIDGVIYYHSRDVDTLNVVGFDVRLETFTSISVPDDIPSEAPTFLMEYGGRLAIVYMMCRHEHEKNAYQSQVIIMGVLTNEEWKCEEYDVPDELLPLVFADDLAGSSPNGELVFVSHYSSNLIKLDCYDMETEQMKEIKVRGPKRTWSGLITKRGAARVCRHAERLESLQALSPTFYHYHRY